ncbi:DUF3313 domain-containing protein [Pararobbsia silviterrae]|uniref:DUF3313 domain-containing protein n=1 Tax=Pararobbsia silviterrae TaxID=1792498 RepID=A0A494XM20_9BURK|nr:DUF3313 domain-containing protein [Pararobbsia silviterrae]RKP51740.1 DUF3313 domain-containing protein [Pararobbsia silviterrae]
MTQTTYLRACVVAMLCTLFVGCASVQPMPYSELSSSNYLHRNMQSDADHVPFRYTIARNWSAYSKLILDPVVIYRGADQQFGDMSDADKAALATYMQSTFSSKLASRFTLAHQAEPGALRMTLTLTGATTTTPVLGAATHFDIGGNLYNAVQAMRGQKALFGGSVTYAVEIHDAATNELLYADVTQQYPNAMNMGAAFGALSAARTGIDKGADALVVVLGGS